MKKALGVVSKGLKTTLYIYEKPIFEGHYTIQGDNFDTAGKGSGQIKFTSINLGLPADVVRKAA